MTRFLLLLLLLVGSSALVAQTAGSIRGKITSVDGEELLFANVAIFKSGNLITGTETDLDGNYSIQNIDPGTYALEVTYTGFSDNRISGITVTPGKTVTVDVEMQSGVNLTEVVVREFKVPLVEKDNTTQGATITSDQIRALPTRDINALATTTAGLSSADEGGNISVRGSRSESTFFYVDGIRVTGNLIPESEIEQLQVVTGGVEAQYGDVTGGVISITTKGPSSKFSGGVEAETSEFLDPYRNSLVGLNLSGPIWKKNGESILGFRLASRYTYRYEDNPPATAVFRATDEALATLEANPITRVGSGFIPTAERNSEEYIEQLDARPNEDLTRIDLTGKIDARLSDAIDIALSGAYVNTSNYFTPGTNTLGSDGMGTTRQRWGAFNYSNNPRDIDNDYRFNFRFRHRIGGSGVDQEENTQSTIRNASYILQFGFEKNLFERVDERYGTNFFDYGYIGRFDREWTPAFGLTDDGQEHIGYLETLTGYQAGTVNPTLANYNNGIEDPNDFLATNGFVSNIYTSAWNQHTNVGQPFDRYSKRENDIYTFQATSSFEIVPKSSDLSSHNIQFGILYEQRVQRGYDVNPVELWLVANQQANNHITGLDTSIVIGDENGVPIYANQVSETNGRFFRELRQITGAPINVYDNPDALNPDQLSLDMFSARELTNQNLVNYWGFDYLGNTSEVSFNDFFTARDGDGNRTHPVAAQRPIYTAAFIQDKFQIKDIIFRVGLRVDRFDANTKVLRDNYALYDINGAAEFHEAAGTTKPGNIGDDYKVYVGSENGSEIKAYRDGNTWFQANGTQVNDGLDIFGGNLVFPSYVAGEKPNIQEEGFDPNQSFVDYEPQINWMPRLAFSFPITEDANFFAHYDVLYQRPPTNTIATALDYFYFEERPGTINNPNLRPERTIDYEVGYQQKLTNSSALKVSAYYKEQSDMIQRRIFQFVAAPINLYTTFDNIDFGTTKGFSFTYDLRRTGNVQLTANYTLQFADGTGSDANSTQGLGSRGLQRALFPLSFDERHRLNLILDYRYGTGSKYNGPMVRGFELFGNTGLNLQTVAVSGRPYTPTSTPLPFSGAGTVGSINGARLPWNFTINARVDRNFSLTKPGAKRPLNMNVYLRVSNLLDRRNVRNVYTATGSPTDDGYLASDLGQAAINGIISDGRDLDGFLASYSWAMLTPGNFTLPRRIFVGAIFDF